MSTNHAAYAWYSPLSINETSGETFGFNAKDAESRYLRAAEYILPLIVGPMPVNEFLDEFMDRDRILAGNQDMPSYEGAFSKVPEGGKREREIYEPLVEALIKPNRCPGFTFHDTSRRPDTEHGRRGSLKPDICCFSLAHSNWVRAHKNDNGPLRFMGYVALFFEVKESPSLDPFTDPPDDCTARRGWKFVLDRTEYSDRDLEEATKALGQNVTYAAEMFARQHRHCCYSVSLSGSFARLIRWDRAGAIVTEAFDIRLYPNHLCEFFWCFAMIGDAGRGYDLTVELGNEVDKFFFEMAIKKHAASQLGPADKMSADEVVSRHFDRDVVTVICVPDLSDGTVPGGVRRLLVSRPIVYPHSITGRATRSYWAVDSTTAEVVFLKDTWRYDPAPSGRCEGETLLHLREHEVPNVPPLVCHGDVRVKDRVMQRLPDGSLGLLLLEKAEYQSTRTQGYIDRPWVCGGDLPNQKIEVRVRKHTHYRLVLGVAGHPLTDFTGTSELLHAAHSTLKAIRGADKAKIIHRDLTPQNIILFKDSKNGHGSSRGTHRMAYLVDWDLSWDTTLEQIKNFPHSASWQFACRDAAMGKRFIYTVEHDMESLLYVVLYCALLWLPHTKSDVVIGIVDVIFDSKTIQQGEPLGGGGKWANADDRRFTKNIRWESEVGKWLKIAMDLLQPLPEDREALSGMWNPRDVDKMCTFFFTKYPNLANGDRKVDLPKLGGRDKDASLNVLGRPFTATRVSSTPAKRDLESHFTSAESPQQSKKVRRSSPTCTSSDRSSRISKKDLPSGGEQACTLRPGSATTAASPECTRSNAARRPGPVERSSVLVSVSTSTDTRLMPVSAGTSSPEESRWQTSSIRGAVAPGFSAWLQASGASARSGSASVATPPPLSTALSTIPMLAKATEAVDRSVQATFKVPEVPLATAPRDVLNRERHRRRKVRDEKR